MNLRTNLVTEVPESFGVKLCPIVHSDGFWHPETTNNILPEKLLDGGRSYCGAHSWFMGFTNVDNPDLVISVITEGSDGSSSGKEMCIRDRLWTVSDE